MVEHGPAGRWATSGAGLQWPPAKGEWSPSVPMTARGAPQAGRQASKQGELPVLARGMAQNGELTFSILRVDRNVAA